MRVPGMSRKSTVHVAASSTEKIFKTTVEIDRLIDNLRSTEYHNVSAYASLKNNVFIWKERFGFLCRLPLPQNRSRVIRMRMSFKCY